MSSGSGEARQLAKTSRDLAVTSCRADRPRRTLLRSMAAVLPAALAACGPLGRARGPGGAGPGALSVPRTVEYWSQYASGPTFETQKALLERYLALNPGATVNTGVAPMVRNVPEKTVAAVAAGTPPDAATFDRFLIASFAVKDTFTRLSDLARRDGITDKEYYPFAWREAGYRGQLYSLAFQTGIRALFVNRVHLHELGVSPDQPARSLTELDQWALRLTRQEGDRYTRIGFIPWVGNSHFYTWGWLFGGEFIDEKTNRCTANDVKIVQALDWLGSYARRYGDERLRAFQNTFGQVDGGAFVGGLVTFFHTTQAQIETIRRTAPQLDYGTTPLPLAPGRSTTSTWAGGFGFIVPRGARQIEAGWHLVKFLGGDEGELGWTQGTLNLPVRVNVAKSGFWQEQARDRRMKVFLDLLPIARSRPVIPAAQLLWDEVAAAVEQVRKGELLPKDALDGVTQRVNLELSKYGG